MNMNYRRKEEEEEEKKLRYDITNISYRFALNLIDSTNFDLQQ